MRRNQLFATKSLQVLLDEMAGDHRLKRVLGPITLTALGVGAVIGAGIFVATGAAAKDVAGPALMISYTVAGLTCIFAALCYAEFASMAPVAGSAYTYAYTTMGELFAWIIGWDLVLEYAVGASAVANGWSGYFQSVLGKLGIVVPMLLSGAPHKYDQGHILPNVTAQVSVEATQMQLDEQAAIWANGETKAAEGNFWVLTLMVEEPLPEGAQAADTEQADDSGEEDTEEATQVVEKNFVLAEVGSGEAEENMRDGKWVVGGVTQSAIETDEKTATWLEGEPRTANGIYWTFGVKEGEKAKTVLVGEVGKPEVEQRIENRERAMMNLPAILVAFLITAVLVKGISESAGFNALMVAIKLAAVLFVIFVGMWYIDPENWSRDFAPYGWTGLSFFGIPVHGQTNDAGAPVGMLAGAAIIFFAYIGFDSVSTHAEEAKNPQRDVPIGIIASLLICTVLYIAVVAVLTGMVPYQELSKDAGVSDAFKHIDLGWAESIIAIAGVAGITSVLLVMMLSAPRVFLAMARDGLVPRSIFASVHPTFKTPWISTILIGVFVATLSGFLPIDALLHLTNIGTLFAFVIVCGAVLIMRQTNPDANRPFRCPLVPVVPILGIGLCLMLMFSLPAANWWRLFAWLALGLVIYFFYGRHHSLLGQELRREIQSHGVSPGGSPSDSVKP